jgi:acetolactate synthase-1/2/3 large subunit
MGIGGFPTVHRLYLGMPGMHGAKLANDALQQCDLLISIGARFDDRVTGKVDQFAPHAKIIHMDIDPAAISKIITVDVPVVGDARKILQELLTRVTAKKAGEWTDGFIQAKKKKAPYSYKKSTKVIKPQHVIELLWEETNGNAVVTTEVGQNQMWAAHYYRFSRPRSFVTSGGLGTMGFGLPAAMGAALALPDTVVIDIAGDGSIQMNIQELATLSINRIPVKIAILNNTYLGMVRQWQELFFDRRYSKTCLRGGRYCEGCEGPEKCTKAYIPDFVKLAESYDVPAFRARTNRDVRSVIRKALQHDGPALMEFVVESEENVYPMVPPGEAIDTVMEE